MFRHFPRLALVAAAIALTTPSLAFRGAINDLDEHTHLLALGDSLTAGVGAMPSTEGYAYLLYKAGIYDPVWRTTFANAAMPGATSDDFRLFEAPLAAGAGFLDKPAADENTPHDIPRVVVMTIGGNDLLSLLSGPITEQAVAAKIQQFANNMISALPALCTKPNTKIYIGNLYTIQNFPVSLPVPFDFVVRQFNDALAAVVARLNSGAPLCPNNVRVADVYSQFTGDQTKLLLINRRGADKFEVHPTNAGHRAIARAFFLAR